MVLKIWVRAIVGIMIFLGYFLLYVVRYNLSVHIVDMAQILIRDYPGSDNETFLIARTVSKTKTRSFYDASEWDDCTMAQLMSAYHIGYCICFPIFHNIGDRLGPTWLVGIAGIISGVLNCLTPAAAYRNFWLLFLVRILKGFCAGAMQPSMVQLLRHWVPPTERHHFMWAYCGITTGTFSTFLICAAVQYYSRWHTGFFICGTSQIVWAVVWLMTISDYPSKHPCISQEELTYLNKTIETIFTIKLTNSRAPWSLILRSTPFWAICIFNFGYAWMIISLCIYGPVYYSRVVGYTIYAASALTALPCFIRLIMGTIVIQSFHWYTHYSEHRIKHLRKYLIVVSHVVPGLLVMSTWFVDIVPGPIVLTLAVSFTAAGMDLTLALCYEISPTYVNSINTVIKIIGNIPGIIVPFSVGAVTHKYKNYPIVWKQIWCFHATVLLISGVIFLIWGDTHVQPWNSAGHSLRRGHRLNIRPSTMSHISEAEEDDFLNRQSHQQSSKRSSLLKGSFKIIQSKV